MIVPPSLHFVPLSHVGPPGPRGLPPCEGSSRRPSLTLRRRVSRAALGLGLRLARPAGIAREEPRSGRDHDLRVHRLVRPFLQNLRAGF
ncbi:Hypothetical protein A7982_02799 [Minicystis rosea]|nr:Hypothetical protein A7982_02799 [Minicystis rosea]